MYMSPETYCSLHIKSLSREELLTYIRATKVQITRLKTSIENPDFLEMMCPTSLSAVDYQRECLKIAKKYYKEAGGVYKMSQAEAKVAAFDKNIPSISRIEVIIGLGCTDARRHSITFDDEYMNVCGIWDGSNGMVDLGRFKSKAFFKDFKKLHIGEWKHSYCFYSSNPEWKLEIYYKNGARKFCSYGSIVPYNFDVLLEVLDKYSDFTDVD